MYIFKLVAGKHIIKVGRSQSLFLTPFQSVTMKINILRGHPGIQYKDGRFRLRNQSRNRNRLQILPIWSRNWNQLFPPYWNRSQNQNRNRSQNSWNLNRNRNHVIIFKWSRNRSRNQNDRVESESEPGPSGTAHLCSQLIKPMEQ